MEEVDTVEDVEASITQVITSKIKKTAKGRKKKIENKCLFSTKNPTKRQSLRSSLETMTLRRYKSQAIMTMTKMEPHSIWSNILNS